MIDAADGFRKPRGTPMYGGGCRHQRTCLCPEFPLNKENAGNLSILCPKSSAQARLSATFNGVKPNQTSGYSETEQGIIFGSNRETPAGSREIGSFHADVPPQLPESICRA
jgi:hypothetical protein